MEKNKIKCWHFTYGLVGNIKEKLLIPPPTLKKKLSHVSNNISWRSETYVESGGQQFRTILWNNISWITGGKRAQIWKWLQLH